MGPGRRRFADSLKAGDELAGRDPDVAFELSRKMGLVEKPCRQSDLGYRGPLEQQALCSVYADLGLVRVRRQPGRFVEYPQQMERAQTRDGRQIIELDGFESVFGDVVANAADGRVLVPDRMVARGRTGMGHQKMGHRGQKQAFLLEHRS